VDTAYLTERSTSFKDMRPIVEGADDLGLDGILDLPEAKQVIAAWGSKNDVAALARGGKVASWLVGALKRRGLGWASTRAPAQSTMRLTVIGGSGGYPGHGRPCGGYLVEADGFAILIDPGYGVATALSADDTLTFNAVVVSHAHPDHCADLNSILRAHAWADPPLPPLPLYALAGALDAVLALDRPEVLAGSYALHPIEPGGELTIGPFQVLTAMLPHPRPNVGFRISAAGRSLVFTGDCGPSDELIGLAAGADVLLAEASYAETVPAEIIGALSSALDVGGEARTAGVQRLILTHLMPRTNEAEAIAAAASSFAGPISVARPGLVVEV
jgi:ribonuclease BN (tRNA processing enzyme)